MNISEITLKRNMIAVLFCNGIFVQVVTELV